MATGFAASVVALAAGFVADVAGAVATGLVAGFVAAGAVAAGFVAAGLVAAAFVSDGFGACAAATAINADIAVAARIPELARTRRFVVAI